jgi:hypothetical protein
MTTFDAMFSDGELVRAFNGAGIQTTPLPDSIMARGLRVVAQYAIAKYIDSHAPTMERIAGALEDLVHSQLHILPTKDGAWIVDRVR